MTTGIKDYRKQFVLNTFYEHGASEDILYLNKPHLGTDVLINVVKNIRKDIKKARKQLRHGEIDLAYVILFPKTEKYISLYPSPNDEDQTDPNVIKGLKITEERRREFRKYIEKLYALANIRIT